MMTKRLSPNIRPLWPWNLCSKTVRLGLFLLALLAWDPVVRAVNINAVYYASCKREVGIIVNVDDEKLAILSLNGTVKRISRFDIIYLAYYPVGEIPIKKITNGDTIDGVTIKTLFKDKLVDLVKGWPVDFSEEKISFLSYEGRETVIDRNSIWEVEIMPSPKTVEFSVKTNKYEFVHPYPFSHCPIEEAKNKDSHAVYPQQLLGDPLFIKNELDRLMKGYEKVNSYNKDQMFYPIPQIYPKRTTLGLWINYNARYGKSSKRRNDFVPAVISELSEGPFGFQRRLVTGSSPIFSTVHEEPQTQFLYMLKADYVHFSFFYDIDRFLIGESEYKWRLIDLNKYDDRVTEIDHISGGFDLGKFAVGARLSDIHYGLRHEDTFFRHRMQMTTFDISFQNLFFHTQFFIGTGLDQKEDNSREGKGRDDEPQEIKDAKEKIAEQERLKPDFKGRFVFYRYNVNSDYLPMKPMFSLIYHDLKFHRDADQNQEGEIHYSSKMITGVFYLNIPVDEDINLAGYLSLENHASKSGIIDYGKKTTNNYPKTGLNVSLIF